MKDERTCNASGSYDRIYYLGVWSHVAGAYEEHTIDIPCEVVEPRRLGARAEARQGVAEGSAEGQPQAKTDGV